MTDFCIAKNICDWKLLAVKLKSIPMQILKRRPIEQFIVSWSGYVDSYRVIGSASPLNSHGPGGDQTDLFQWNRPNYRSWSLGLLVPCAPHVHMFNLQTTANYLQTLKFGRVWRLHLDAIESLTVFADLRPVVLQCSWQTFGDLRHGSVSSLVISKTQDTSWCSVSLLLVTKEKHVDVQFVDSQWRVPLVLHQHDSGISIYRIEYQENCEKTGSCFVFARLARLSNDRSPRDSKLYRSYSSLETQLLGRRIWFWGA